MQLRERALSEHVGDPLFGCSRFAVDGPIEAAPFRCEPNDAGAPVGGIGFTDEVTVLFEVAQQVVD